MNYYIIFLLVILIILLFNRNTSTIDDPLADMPIYVINVESRPDRKKNIEETLQDNNINNATIIKAVDGKKLDMKSLINDGVINTNKKIYRTLKRGEIGCYLSHIKCWDLILKSGQLYGMIIEDDIIFGDNFRYNFNNAFNRIKHTEWDIFHPGRNCRNFDNRCRDGVNFTDDNNIIYPYISGYGTLSYVITAKCIKKLMKDIFPIIKPIDVVILDEYDKGNIKVIGLRNDLLVVRSFADSDTSKIV